MENNLVSFTPANIVLVGKTASEKRVSLAGTAGTIATSYIACGKGKAATVARASLGEASIAAMGRAVAEGNYRPVAEALAFTLGESIAILKLADLDSLVWSIDHRIANMKDGGFSAKTGKPTAALTALNTAHLMLETVLADAADIIANRVAARALAKMA